MVKSSGSPQKNTPPSVDKQIVSLSLPNSNPPASVEPKDYVWGQMTPQRERTLCAQFVQIALFMGMHPPPFAMPWMPWMIPPFPPGARFFAPPIACSKSDHVEGSPRGIVEHLVPSECAASIAVPTTATIEDGVLSLEPLGAEEIQKLLDEDFCVASFEKVLTPSDRFSSDGSGTLSCSRLSNLAEDIFCGSDGDDDPLSLEWFDSDYPLCNGDMDFLMMDNLVSEENTKVPITNLEPLGHKVKASSGKQKCKLGIDKGFGSICKSTAAASNSHTYAMMFSPEDALELQTLMCCKHTKDPLLEAFDDLPSFIGLL